MINQPAALIVYQPGPPGTEARVNISSLAETILAFAKDPTGKTIPTREAATGLCAKWVALMEKPARGPVDPEDRDADVPPILGLFQSHRRKYAVRGIALDGRLLGAVSRYPSYVFALERADPSAGFLQRICREKKLSPRERDLVNYLFSDLSNKEIGQAMGLSPNTVKGYLKSLALKLGVSSRVGILAALYQPRRDGRRAINRAMNKAD